MDTLRSDAEGNLEQVEIGDYRRRDEPMAKRPNPVRPGEYLKELLEVLALSQYGLAHSLGTLPRRISHVVP